MSISIIIQNLGNIINSINYNFILAIIYLITLIVLICQYRLQSQPILYLKLKAQNKNSKQKGLEYIGGDSPPEIYGGDDNYRLFVSNESNHIAKSINIKISYKIKDKKIEFSENHFLTYLNPNEYTSMILYFPKKLMGMHPNEFKIIKNGKTEYIVPNETMKLEVFVNISHTNRYKLYNEYFIEWIGLDSMPNQNKIKMHCWNKRNGLYIYQIK